MVAPKRFGVDVTGVRDGHKVRYGAILSTHLTFYKIGRAHGMWYFGGKFAVFGL